MNETTNQMSLLDAIGFSAPEATKDKKKDKPAKAGTSSAKPRKKGAAKGEIAAGPAPDQSAEADTGRGTDKQDALAQATASDAREPAIAIAAIDIPETADGHLPLDKYICFALYSANHAMHGVYKSLLKDIGLTYPQFLAMTVLWETNNVPVGTITSKLQLDTNTLTPLLKRLETMGLVTRTRNPKDERQVILKLTRKGRALQKKTEEFANCIFSASGLALEEIMDLQNRIIRLRDNLRASGLES